MSAFTRKHFAMVAACLRRCYEEGMDASVTRRLAGEFADMFKAANPAFDRQRFFDACGLGESP